VWPAEPDQAKLLIIGLAPGLHGANRTGIPFTGDASGDLLFKTLRSHNLAPEQHATCITNVVKCVPPENRPNGTELKRCRRYLTQELASFKSGVVLCLGRTSHDSVITALGHTRPQFPFSHGANHQLDDIVIVDSYHCSRYNINTGRLTEEMFNQVISQVKALL